MGNSNQGSNKIQKSKISLNLRVQQIIIHSSYNFHLILSDVQTFPHGLDGLKLWQAGIILSRYIIINTNIFKNKSVLQLGSGVGIAGITVKKWTEAKSIQMTDYHPKVIQLIKNNLNKNNQKIQTYLFDWRQRHQINKMYDLIIGSDIVYFGCPVKDLYQVFQQKLNINGKGIIIIPDRKNYAELFINQINKDIFHIDIQILKNQTYLESPLINQDKAKFQYGLLWKIPFKALIITKKCHNNSSNTKI